LQESILFLLAILLAFGGFDSEPPINQARLSLPMKARTLALTAQFSTTNFMVWSDL